MVPCNRRLTCRSFLVYFFPAPESTVYALELQNVIDPTEGGAGIIMHHASYIHLLPLSVLKLKRKKPRTPFLLFQNPRRNPSSVGVTSLPRLALPCPPACSKGCECGVTVLLLLSFFSPGYLLTLYYTEQLLPLSLQPKHARVLTN